eukprot:6173008-Pleurochrysis_carterae.AAC.1
MMAEASHTACTRETKGVVHQWRNQGGCEEVLKKCHSDAKEAGILAARRGSESGCTIGLRPIVQQRRACRSNA